jgi:hypothetical protein
MPKVLVKECDLRIPEKLHRAAKLGFDLHARQAEILWGIYLYWNGIRLKIKSKYGPEKKIGVSHPPKIRDLLYASKNCVEYNYEYHINELKEFDVLKSGSICRTQIEYLLTERGKSLIEELVERALPADYGFEKGLKGDDNELLTHRFLVMVSEIYVGAGCNKIMYPSWNEVKSIFDENGPLPDAIYKFEHNNVPKFVAVEAWTGNNDYKRGIQKMDSWRHSDINPVWIFPDSAAAARFINRVQLDPDFGSIFEYPNAPFENPDNYRINRLREYLLGRDRDNNCPGMYDITTPTQLLEGSDIYVPGRL